MSEKHDQFARGGMKISIITVCFNARDTIADTLRSVAAQTFPAVEHIVIDGGSSDGTQDVIRKHGTHLAKVVSEPDRGIYDGMNKGLAHATGDVVAFLNADDIYVGPQVLQDVADTLADPAVDACYANLVYVDRERSEKVVRVWHSKPFVPGAFRRGWMPAHPTLFVRRKVFDDYGHFDLSYPQQADFDLTMRFFELAGIRSRYVPNYWVQMRAGGVSNRSIRSVLKGNLEAWRICRKNKLDVPPWFIAVKIGSRLSQFLPGRAEGYDIVR